MRFVLEPLSPYWCKHRSHPWFWFSFDRWESCGASVVDGCHQSTESPWPIYKGGRTWNGYPCIWKKSWSWKIKPLFGIGNHFLAIKSLFKKPNTLMPENQRIHLNLIVNWIKVVHNCRSLWMASIVDVCLDVFTSNLFSCGMLANICNKDFGFEVVDTDG